MAIIGGSLAASGSPSSCPGGSGNGPAPQARSAGAVVTRPRCGEAGRAGSRVGRASSVASSRQAASGDPKPPHSEQPDEQGQGQPRAPVAPAPGGLLDRRAMRPGGRCRRRRGLSRSPAPESSCGDRGGGATAWAVGAGAVADRVRRRRPRSPPTAAAARRRPRARSRAPCRRRRREQPVLGMAAGIAPAPGVCRRVGEQAVQRARRQGGVSHPSSASASPAAGRRASRATRRRPAGSPRSHRARTASSAGSLAGSRRSRGRRLPAPGSGCSSAASGHAAQVIESHAVPASGWPVATLCMSGADRRSDRAPSVADGVWPALFPM